MQRPKKQDLVATGFFIGILCALAVTTIVYMITGGYGVTLQDKSNVDFSWQVHEKGTR